ncbi:acyltransferase [Candidatus Micrarchaeota archaeon]|nr:acyltransferase [Candidatus Micrarchaeota archaeon]
MRNIRTIKVNATNSLLKWYKVKNPLIVIFNFIVIYFSRIVPSLSLKRFLLRLTGMKIEKNVSIGLMAMFDIFFPELITIKENSIIGYNATVLCHEFLIKEVRIGEVVIGRNALIGTNSTILPGVSIGDNSTVSAMSLINKDIPANKIFGGVPAKEINKEVN